MLEERSIVDLRSDTVTRPTPAMRRAMAEAEVGDDVYGEDPTMNRLQARAAEIFKREAALFVPSGSMGNLLALKVWTRPGMEVICEERAHIHQFELASMSAIAGCMPRTRAAPDGILTWDLIEPLFRPKIYYRAGMRPDRTREHAQHARRHRLSARMWPRIFATARMTAAFPSIWTARESSTRPRPWEKASPN